MASTAEPIDSGAQLELRRQLDQLLTAESAASRAFAEAQRGCLRDLVVPVPGGEAGHRLLPLGRAGCYAPGGRFPLPSSVLMTAVTARVEQIQELT